MSSRHTDPTTLRWQSLLFVPATRLDRLEKALASNADSVCIDLEDSVPADGKEAARATVCALLAGRDEPRLTLRINGLRTKAGLADLLALADHPAPLPLILLPMVESATEVAIAASILGGAATGFIPLVETPAGLRRAREIGASVKVAAMMFGGGDLSSELGVELAWEPLAVARALFLLACAEAGVPAIDVPFIRLDDMAGLADETGRAKALGFSAKAAIHPDQIAAIHRVMRPSSDEIEEAEAAVRAFAEAGGRAMRFRGRMLEAPIMRRYETILAYKDKINA